MVLPRDHPGTPATLAALNNHCGKTGHGAVLEGIHAEVKICSGSIVSPSYTTSLSSSTLLSIHVDLAPEEKCNYTVRMTIRSVVCPYFDVQLTFDWVGIETHGAYLVNPSSYRNFNIRHFCRSYCDFRKSKVNTSGHYDDLDV